MILGLWLARYSLVVDAPTLQLANPPTSLRVALFVCPLVVLFAYSRIHLSALSLLNRRNALLNSSIANFLVLNYLNYSVLDIFTSKCFVVTNKIRILAS